MLFRRLALSTTIAVYLLLLLGGIVSGTGAGLACPDWPLCHGRLIPPLEGPILIEWTHRLVAALVGLLVLATAIAAWTKERHRAPIPQLSSVALLLLIGQAVLGGLTVKLELPTAINVAHLALGMALFGVMIWLSAQTVRKFASSQRDAHLPTCKLANYSLWTTLALYAQIILGAWVRHSGAALACPDVPLCQGQLLPSTEGTVLIHLAHRLGGLIVAGLIIWLTIRVLRQPGISSHIVRHAIVAVGLVVLQIGLGVFTVLSRLSLHVATTHLAVGAALLGLMVLLSARLRLEGRPSVEPATARREAVV